MGKEDYNDLEIESIFDFPKGTPEISCASWSMDGNVLVTGHINGFFAIWDVHRQRLVKKSNLGSLVKKIDISVKNEVLIACYSGDIFLLSNLSGNTIKLIKKGENNKYTRIWNLNWVDATSFIATSTYGKIFVYSKSEDGTWEFTQLVQHNNSIFSSGIFKDKLATGDYTGLIIIWKLISNQFEVIAKIKTSSVIEDIKWKNETSFSALTMTGHVLYIEFDEVDKSWSIVFDAFVALERGISNDFVNSGKDIIAITGGELLHIGLNSQQVNKNKVNKGITIDRLKKDDVRVVTQSSILKIKVHDIRIDSSLIKYKYAKISLFGHTNVGKSRLCDNIVGGHEYDEQSTYGKKIWEWDINSQEEKKKVVFHDHGGQSSVMYTYIPFILDSDILLLLFSKTDKTTLDIIMDLLPKIKERISENTKIMLVETKTDQVLQEISDDRLQEMVKNGIAMDALKTSSVNGTGIEELKSKLMKEISWDKARVIIRSKESENLLEIIKELQKKEAYIFPWKEIQKRYNSKYGTISQIHLKFLLGSFSNEGVIEYYPEASDYIVFGGKHYKELRSEIPIYASEKNGIVNINEVLKKFSGQESYSKLEEYIKIIDSLFQRYKIHIKNNALRIYPEKLRDNVINTKDAGFDFSRSKIDVLTVNLPKIDHSKLIEALCDMALQCVDLTAREGLFKWEDNAYIYYSISQTGDDISGIKNEFRFYLGGKVEKYVKRLREAFINLVDSFYGPINQKNLSK